ncbi:MAG: HEAT repeat domain-containing protein [Nitrospirae bacterium]|nr:HEAT repeat domain-containing protein [Nitrospirota bacterium]
MQEVQELLLGLQSSNWWVRKERIEKLLGYPEGLYMSVLEAWIKKDDDALLRNASMEAYRALGRRSLNSLVSLLQEDDADVRIFSANLLGDIKDSNSLPALIEAMADPDDNVRIAAAEALGKIGDKRAIPALTASLDDVPWAVMAAIESIGIIGGEEALSVLYRCLERDEYCGMACAAIAKAGNLRSLPYLMPYLQRGDIREFALKAVVSIAERDGIRPAPAEFEGMAPLLTELLGSPDNELRKAAFIALSWTEDVRTLPCLFDALNDDRLQEYAVKAIISVAGKAVPEIIEALKRPGRNRVILAKILSMCGEDKALLEFAGDEDAEVRTEAALALGNIGDAEAQEALARLRRDPVEEVRAAACRSVKKTGKDK